MRIGILFFLTLMTLAGNTQWGWWHAELHRADGMNIIFVFEWRNEKGKNVWYIHNASEKIRVQDITRAGDSILVEMPVFESQFRIVYSHQKLEGVWIKGGAVKTQVIPFTAEPGKNRFPVSKATGKKIAGRWATVFGPGKIADPAVAEFKQVGNLVSGTFLSPTGDYRYLEGAVKNDSLFLSCFDGGHAYLFTARIESNKKISGGWYYSGATSKKEWEATKNADAKSTSDEAAMYLKPGEERLYFTFNDLDGKPVSINDEQFKNKVVVIQIMGSWCPNCMDETAYLSDYYNRNKERGVAIISLAYEYSTDRERSVKSLRKFQKRFNVQYPILITGVTANDSLKTEKTLPQLTPIKTFPSSILLDRKGRVRKLDTSFNGPATGEHYVAYKKEFESMIENLLKEK